MRRVGLVLAGLGTCLIVFAVAAASWITGQVIKFPLNEFATVTLSAPNATYFSVAKLTEVTGVNLEATYTIKGNAAAGSSSTAVWNQFVYVYDQTNKAPIQSMTRTFAFDRRSAQLINCCGSNVGGDSSVEQHGYVGYVLPIGTKKQTYDVFDTNLKKAVPFTYAGIGDVDGTQAYKFTENVAPTQNGTQTVPGSLVNQAAASVTLPQYYEVHTTYWIDPVTGALLNVTQNEKLTLRNTDGTQALVLLNANLAATQASIDGLVALDNDQVSKASLVGTLLPLATGIVGLLLLIIGIVLFRRPEADAEAATSRREPELAAAEPEAEAASHPSLVPGLEDEPREATVESPVVREAAVNEAAKTADVKTAEAEVAETKAAEAKAAEDGAAASDAKAADAEAKAEDKAAEADAEPASPAAAAEATEARTEAAQAETAAEDSKAQAEAKAEEAKAEEAKAEAPAAEAPAAEAPAEDARADVAPAEAPTAEIPAADADTAESPAAADGTAETAAPTAPTSRRRRGTHRR
jgi:Porin PorA